MFRTLQNVVHLDCTLVPDGPILVRSGVSSLDPGIADMEFQRTVRDGRRTVFLAGSGLKGALRSHCERLLNAAGRFACDPTRAKKDSPRGGAGQVSRHGEKDPDVCSNRKLGQKLDRKHPHAGQCAACFTFGSLQLAGRFRVADAYPKDDLWTEANATEARTQVAIDRRSQGPAGGALFNTEVVVGGGFSTRITGENFSLWQLGLVLQALLDLQDGVFQIGGSKARGMGTVDVRDLSVDLRFLAPPGGKLLGARQPPDSPGYSLPHPDEVPIPKGGVESRHGLFHRVVFGGEAVDALRELLVEERLRPYLGGKT